jgi:small-conductance mechanosensitive channel
MLSELNALFAEWFQDIRVVALRLALIVLILILTVVISRRAQRAVRRFSGHTQAPQEISDLLGRLTRIGVLLYGIYLVLTQLGLNDAALTFITSFGVIGIVAGFALQDIVKQFVAGVLLLMQRPFRLGDHIKIDTFEGTVVEIQLRITVLKTDEGDEVLIPNADVFNKAVINRSRYDVRRRSLTFTIPSIDETGEIRDALVRAVGDVPRVVAQPPPTIAVTGVEEGTLPIELRYWIDTSEGAPDAITNQVIAAMQRVLSQHTPPQSAR